MRILSCFFICLFNFNFFYAQSIAECKNKFNTYLNFKGSLNSSVSFGDESISILNAAKPEFTVYTDEINIMALLLENQTPLQFAGIYNWKKNTHLTKKQLDSLLSANNLLKETHTKPTTPSLQGKKIAIDPGHFAGNMEVARIEQKFIDFAPSPANTLKDTIRFNEGVLTYQTAHILKHQLEEKGAQVLVTRPQQNYTSFKITYDEWFLKRKDKVLDSLADTGSMDAAKKNRLKKLTKEKLFWDFFRDYELMERARVVNEFKPDITVIIHYNVDEKNTDWKNPTTKNFTMTFIGGGMTADNFSKQTNKIHFLRLLLTNHLGESEKLSALTVKQFNMHMQIPIAKQQDADYLKENCLKTPSAGVFCRNLALCRTINSPLVYGECLYQDHEKECLMLIQNNTEIYNIKVSKRIYEAANCYYNAINEYFSKL